MSSPVASAARITDLSQRRNGERAKPRRKSSVCGHCSAGGCENQGMRKSSPTRIALGAFIASIVANAIIGIWALLSGDFGETQGKVLLTSMLVSAAMLGILVNMPAVRRRVVWPMPVVGAMSAAAGFALFIVLAWADAETEEWFKVAGSLLVVAAAATLSSSLAIPSSQDVLRWLLPLAHVLITVLALTVLYGLWFEPDSEPYARLVGVEAVLVAAATLVIPVLPRFAASRRRTAEGQLRGQEEAPLHRGGVHMIRFCPSCGQSVAEQPVDTTTPVQCPRCGLRFTVSRPDTQ